MLTNSQDPTSLLISEDTLCSPANVDFSISDGQLGTLAQWELIEDSCSGNLIATSLDGNFSDVSVSESKSYFVNAKGFCDTTNCVSVNFVLATTSQDPTSLLISEDTICSPSNVDFSISDGQLGTLAQWELIEDSCSGNLIATSLDGNFSDVSVSESKSYFVNAKGFCDTTNCVSVDLLLGTSSIIANEILFNDSIICQGELVSLYLNSGSLGTNGQWNWYKDACGGSPIAQGDSVNLTQYSTSNYFVRAEGYCNNTNCLNELIRTPPHFIDLDSITMDSTMNATDSTWYLPDSVCPESPVTLQAHYTDEFPNGYSITWYLNSCGSVPFDVGESITVYPDSTTTYYARVIGTCGASLCKSITVYTKNGSLSPTGIIASANNFCTGGSTTLTVEGGLLDSNAQWTWYEGSCSGSSIGNGFNISVTPASTNNYFVRATGGECGNTACASILINTHDLLVYHSPLGPICESQQITLEGGFPENGYYSGNAISGNIFSGSVGLNTITYNVTDDNNCSGSFSFDIEVLAENPDPILLTASS